MVPLLESAVVGYTLDGSITNWDVFASKFLGFLADVKAAASKHARNITERHARNLARLVDDLLDVGRVLTGKVRLDAFLAQLTPPKK